MNINQVRQSYIEPIFIKLIDSDTNIEEMAIYLNDIGTKDDAYNVWNVKGVEHYLRKIGFPYYAKTHPPKGKEGGYDGNTLDDATQ